MAKKELNFGKLGLPAKATIVKKDEAKEPLIEKAIEKIHGDAQKGRVVVETPTPPPVAIEETPAPIVQPVVVAPTVAPAVAPAAKTAKAVAVQAIELDEMMPVKKISMDLPLDVYKYLKINSFDQAVTMKEYVLRLIEADMKRGK
jgi:hypothetical protein